MYLNIFELWPISSWWTLFSWLSKLSAWNNSHYTYTTISPGSREVNLVLLDKVFFSTVSCSLGIALQDSGGCQVISLEHFQILTLFQNGRRRNWGKSNFWTRPPRNLCDTSFKSNLITKIPILTLFLCHDLILTPKVNMSAIRLTKNSAEIGENLTFEPDHLEICVIPLLRVISPQWFQFWHYFCVMTSFWPTKLKMAAIGLTKNSAEIRENLTFEPNHLETCVIPLLRVI